MPLLAAWVLLRWQVEHLLCWVHLPTTRYRKPTLFTDSFDQAQSKKNFFLIKRNFKNKNFKFPRVLHSSVDAKRLSVSTALLSVVFKSLCDVNVSLPLIL
jgi:hypothetical protein